MPLLYAIDFIKMVIILILSVSIPHSADKINYRNKAVNGNKK